MKKAALLLFAVTLATQAQQPVFQTETKIVLVNAVVTDKKGQYIRGLTAKDFHVLEDKKEQTIRSLSAGNESSDGGRLILFFDDTHMNAAEQIGARRAAAGFIDSLLAAGGHARLVAVVIFDGGFRVAQNFTDNADRLKQALRGSTTVASAPSPGVFASTTAPDWLRLVQSTGNLARNLNAAPGRKILVIFTGGALFSGAPSDDLARLVQISNRSNVAIYPVLQQNGIHELVLSGNDCDPRRPGANFPGPNNTKQPEACAPVGSGGAQSVASGTGGFVLYSSNDLLAELRRVDAEQNESYVLAYTPPESKEGTCHSLRVKVDRGGAVVRVRSSYCATKPQDVLAKTKVEQALEKHVAVSETGAAARATIQTAYFYVAPNVARVHAVMEIAPESIQLETQKGETQKGKLHAELNILGVASAPDGSVAARFTDVIRRDFDNRQDAGKWKAQPLYYAKEFKIVPGQYRLTIAFSSAGAAFGKIDTPLTVPAWDRGQLALSALALSAEVRPASNLGLETSLIDDGTPLIAGPMQVIPAGSTAFPKSRQVFCYFEVYSSGGAVALRARILDSKTGAGKWNSGDGTLAIPAGAATASASLELPIAELQAGTFRIEVAATTPDGMSARQTSAFELR